MNFKDDGYYFIFQLTLYLLVVLAAVAWGHTMACTVSTPSHIRRVVSLKTLIE
jgi:hypothetical protein